MRRSTQYNECVSTGSTRICVIELKYNERKKGTAARNVGETKETKNNTGTGTAVLGSPDCGRLYEVCGRHVIGDLFKICLLPAETKFWPR